MADNAEVIWLPEQIPETDKLYMRVHRSYVKNGAFVPGVFQDKGNGMSTEWERYSTPAETKDRAKQPNDNGVIEMVSGLVASIQGLRVEHTPDVERRVRGHTDVVGDKKKDPEIRMKLKRLSRWVPGFELA